VAETYFNVCHPPDEQTRTRTTVSQLFQGREWLDLRALTQYASVSERTMREWIHRSANPLPAVRVGAKILVRRSEFDRWLEKHRLEPIDIGSVVSEVVSDLIGANS
jgi:excisionase family DNA binding protein